MGVGFEFKTRHHTNSIQHKALYYFYFWHVSLNLISYCTSKQTIWNLYAIV